MKILASDQIRKADKFTIENEPIDSIDLVERASRAFVEKFKLLVTNKNCKVSVFCGIGNNGGDGMAIARMLHHKGRPIRVFSVGDLNKASADFSINQDKLPDAIDYVHLSTSEDFPLVSDQEVIVDALFGSGLSREIKGLHGELIKHLNSCQADIFSVDIASGLFSDKAAEGIIVEPTHTISFQVPKLVFFQPSLEKFVGNWHVVDIGLDEEYISSLSTSHNLTTYEEMKPLLPIRSKFSHKGNAGRMLLISGSHGKMGAAFLAAKAAFRSGVGLLHIHSPSCGTDVLQSSIPEAMIIQDAEHHWISDVNVPDKVNAIAIGPGLGTNSKTEKALKKLLEESKAPLVLDADAINILSKNKAWLKHIPKESILTPHPGEFKRLVGDWKDDFQKLELLQEFCRTHRVSMVLKGAFSAVCNSNGIVFFNPTGNPGMATAGSGDVLTGIVGSLFSQDLKPFDALRLGVFLHGLSGDLAKKSIGEISLISSDLIDFLPEAILSLNAT